MAILGLFYGYYFRTYTNKLLGLVSVPHLLLVAQPVLQIIHCSLFCTSHPKIQSFLLKILPIDYLLAAPI